MENHEAAQKGIEGLLKEILAESFTNLGRKHIQIHEAQITSIKIKKSKPTPRHIIVKFAKYKYKEKKSKNKKKPLT